MPHALMGYTGGKQALIPWLYRFFPQHKRYVEVFGGTAGVLLNKTRSKEEVYNDLDKQMVNLFRVIREPQLRAELTLRLAATPHSDEAFREACDKSLRAELGPDDPPSVELAWAKMIAHIFGFGSKYAGTFARVVNKKSFDWDERFQFVAERFHGVIVENADWAWLVDRYDGPDTLFYADPPYNENTSGVPMYSSQTGKHLDEQLVEGLRGIKGRFLLSGFDCRLFNRQGWYRIEKVRAMQLAKDKAGKRYVEVLWANFPLTSALELPRLRRWWAGAAMAAK